MEYFKCNFNSSYSMPLVYKQSAWVSQGAWFSADIWYNQISGNLTVQICIYENMSPL